MARILCVDDEPHVVTLKCAILERAGHVVTASTSAQDAIQKLQSDAYDAVVTDWRLGDANGRTVVEAAKRHSSTPVVVVSGYVAEAFQAAVDDLPDQRRYRDLAQVAHPPAVPLAFQAARVLQCA